TLSCLQDRSSRPQRSPRELAAAEQERICEVRHHTGWGPRLIAGVVGRPHSTVHRTLQRRGCSRRPREPREEVVRYEWPCPGDLLHMDTKRYARFERPGHAVTGDRSVVSRGVGWEYSHSIVDDHSRLVYAEILDSQDAKAVVAFTRRALAFFEANGITVRRLMTDNAWAYTKSKQLRKLLRKRKITHKRTRPRRPQTNGKAERFIIESIEDGAAPVATKPKPAVKPKTTAKAAAPVTEAAAEEVTEEAAEEPAGETVVEDQMVMAIELAVGKTEAQFKSAISVDERFAQSQLLSLAKAGMVTLSLVKEGKLVQVGEGAKAVYQLPE
ncbi:hypothetical protein LCGC14_2869300, partial [marine sediment metagenome]